MPTLFIYMAQCRVYIRFSLLKMVVCIHIQCTTLTLACFLAVSLPHSTGHSPECLKTLGRGLSLILLPCVAMSCPAPYCTHSQRDMITAHDGMCAVCSEREAQALKHVPHPAVGVTKYHNLFIITRELF